MYAPVIEANCRLNSKGEPLKDVASILIQERSIAHRNGPADEDYFTTAERRAEITQMLARGEANDLEEIILKGRDPVLRVSVYRKNDGKLAMRLGMRSRDQEDYEKIREDDEAANDTEKSAETADDAAQSRLPSDVIVGTDSISPKEFKQWVDNDPTNYSGNYVGEVGGDSGGELEIKLTKGKAGTYPPFSVSGVFKVQAVQSQAKTVTFGNAACDPDHGPEVDAAAFKIFFVLLDGKQGVVVGNIFLPKK
jgi:hypothetical protein